VKRINSLVAASRMDARGAGRLVALLRDLDTVLSILDFDQPQDTHAEIHALLQARVQARAERNWLLSDQLRDELIARGIRVQDQRLDS
jgi:cysteinyl-tRNA synthetase